MMKNKDKYAVAVRKLSGEIEVEVSKCQSISDKVPFFRLPIIRGVVNFVESMVVGVKTLTYSASFYEDEEEEPTKMNQALDKLLKGKTEDVMMGVTVCFSMLLAIALFMVAPYFATRLLERFSTSETMLVIVEGMLRIGIFLLYVALISQMKDMKRVFMYHGAEHKTINCLEHGEELTVENVKKYSRIHKRCGTSFLLIVMIISMIFFLFIRVDGLWARMAFRILLVPVIAGVSYEFIKFAGKSDSKIVQILSTPGMWLQKLTTREPEEDMIEVAIQSVESVL
ncbi:MAG: DUF1385 domain-containing protein [Lachnospiraceae bacterium]|nr:DUF1385 domain-containing protein [Lachnospiraceae bacterium]